MGIDSQELAVVEPMQAEPAFPAPSAPPVYAPPVYAPPFETVAAAPTPVAVAAKRGGRGWIVPAAIAVVGVIASGSLGYLLYSTNNRLEATRHSLTETQLTLDSTKKDLAADLAAQKEQAAYVNLYETDLGRLSDDYTQLAGCDSFSLCKTATTTMLGDAESFQQDRQAAKVPAAYTNVDAMLGDGLTADIAALKELSAALSSKNSDRVQNGFSDVNDATLSIFKTEAALGKQIG